MGSRFERQVYLLRTNILQLKKYIDGLLESLEDVPEPEPFSAQVGEVGDWGRGIPTHMPQPSSF